MDFDVWQSHLLKKEKNERKKKRNKKAFLDLQSSVHTRGRDCETRFDSYSRRLRDRLVCVPFPVSPLKTTMESKSVSCLNHARPHTTDGHERFRYNCPTSVSSEHQNRGGAGGVDAVRKTTGIYCVSASDVIFLTTSG